MALVQIYNNLDRLPDHSTDPYLNEAHRRTCARDPIFFLKNYVYTLDAREPSAFKKKPFPVHPYMIPVINDWMNKDNMFIEKTRQMTLSWLLTALSVHALVFEHGATTFFGSRSEEEVDDGGAASTVDSLFGKIRFIIEHLPNWIISDDPSICFTDGNFSKLRITAPHHHGFIKGEAATKNMGRGSTNTRAIMDECAFIPYARKAYSSMRQTTQAMILNSTPNGDDPNQLFFGIKLLIDEKGEAGSGFKKHTLHWTQHPHRDAAWYEKAKVGLTDVEVAQELDIDYSGSLEGKVYPELDYSKHVSKDGLRYDPRFDLRLGFDFGIADPTAIWVYQRIPNRSGAENDRFNILGYQEYPNIPPSICAIRLTDYLRQTIAYSGPTLRIIGFGDPSGINLNANASSYIKEWRLAGYEIRTKGIRSHREGSRIINARKLLGRTPAVIQFDPTNCKIGVARISNFHYPQVEEGRQAPKDSKMKTFHDINSHGAKAFEYFTCAETMLKKTAPKMYENWM